MNDWYSPRRYHHELERAASQAATHLHNAVGKVGTALFRQDSTLVFSHNALDYVDFATLARFVGGCLVEQKGQHIQRHSIKDLKVWAMALDTEHAFLVVGRCPDEQVVMDFLTHLRLMLRQRNHQ